MISRELMNKILTSIRAVFLLFLLTACGAWAAEEREVPGGDRRRGEQALQDYGCGYCHLIPGVDGASGVLAMPLIDWGDRQLIAGHFPNNVEYMVPWIQDPPGMLPSTAMPDLGVTTQDALDMTAYLFSLRQTDPVEGAVTSVVRFFEGLFTDPPPPPEDPGPRPEHGDPVRAWELYSHHCAECHRFFGEGFPGSVPALDGNPFVTGDPGPVIEVVVHGLRGMPAFGDILQEHEIAAVVNHIRTAWSNRADPVDAAQVDIDQDNEN
jgi:cytochrome c